MAACTGRHGAVIAQIEIDGKTGELSAFEPLLRPLDLTGTVVTADALHTQRDHARFLVTEKNAHFILVVKKNQPSLYHQLKQLPWRQVPIGHTQDHHGHGRTERRSIKVAGVQQGLLFPHAAQAIQITRKPGPAGGPAVMATLRNLAISLLKLCGWTNIAQANRRHLQDAHRCLATLGLTTGHHDP